MPISPVPAKPDPDEPAHDEPNAPDLPPVAPSPNPVPPTIPIPKPGDPIPLQTDGLIDPRLNLFEPDLFDSISR